MNMSNEGKQDIITNEKIDFSFGDILFGIKSPYNPGHAGIPIDLYFGPIQYDLVNGVRTCDASVKLVWLPKPHILINWTGQLGLSEVPGISLTSIRFIELDIVLQLQRLGFSGDQKQMLFSGYPVSSSGIGDARRFRIR